MLGETIRTVSKDGTKQGVVIRPTIQTLTEQLDTTENILKLRRELEAVIIKVNYHFQSGYERHVNLQTPESIFLNFLKKMITIIPQQYMHRVSKSDFTLTMQDNYVIHLIFHKCSLKHDWKQLDDQLALLSKAAFLLEYEELKDRSHSLEKWLQQTDNIINSIKDFKFS